MDIPINPGAIEALRRAAEPGAFTRLAQLDLARVAHAGRIVAESVSRYAGLASWEFRPVIISKLLEGDSNAADAS